jgi:hypothetical protein
MNMKTQRSIPLLVSHALNQPGSFSHPSNLHRSPPCVSLGQPDLLVEYKYTHRQPVTGNSTGFHFSPTRVDFKSSCINTPCTGNPPAPQARLVIKLECLPPTQGLQYPRYHQLRFTPPLLLRATKLAAITPSGPEAENSNFQYKLALNKLSTNLTKIKESNPGRSLNATTRLHQAIRRTLLRNCRYNTLSWNSASEIDAGADYPQLVGVSSK